MFGGGPPASNRRYSLTFSVNARNALNKVNRQLHWGAADQSVRSIGFREVDCSGGRRILERGGQSKN